MAEYRDVLSLPIARAPESRVTAEQSSTRRHWNQKRYPPCKDKGEATMRR